MFSKITKVDSYKNLPTKLSKGNAPKEDTTSLSNKYQKKDFFIPYIFRSSEEVEEKEEDIRIRKEVIADIVKHTKDPDVFLPYPLSKKEDTKGKHALLSLDSNRRSSDMDMDMDMSNTNAKTGLKEVDLSEVSELEDEEEKVFILDEPDIIMRETPYFYLNQPEDFMNDTLTQEWLAKFENQQDAKVEIHIGLYKLNSTIDYLPFVTYFLEKNADNENDMYQFPHFTLSIPKDPLEDILQMNCENECKTRLFRYLDIFPSETFSEETLANIVFKGYVMRENEVLAVFETRDQNSDSDDLKNGEWVTLHEIINTKFVHTHLVHPFVSKWFLENPDLLYIKDNRNNAIDIPYVLYLLEPNLKSKSKSKSNISVTGGENKTSSTSSTSSTSTISSVLSSIQKLPELITSSISITDSDTSESVKETESKTKKVSKYKPIERSYAILPPKITHPNLGEIFLFSERGTEIARKVVFITNTLYLLDQPPDFSLFSKKNYNSIYFQENGEPIWGIKNPVFFGDVYL